MCNLWGRVHFTSVVQALLGAIQLYKIMFTAQNVWLWRCYCHVAHCVREGGARYDIDLFRGGGGCKIFIFAMVEGSETLTSACTREDFLQIFRSVESAIFLWILVNFDSHPRNRMGVRVKSKKYFPPLRGGGVNKSFFVAECQVVQNLIPHPPWRFMPCEV